MGGRGGASGAAPKNESLMPDYVKHAIDGDNYVEVLYRDYKNRANGFELNYYRAVPGTYDNEKKTVKVDLKSPITKELYNTMPKNAAEEVGLERDSRIGMARSIADAIKNQAQNAVKENRKMKDVLQKGVPEWFKRAYAIGEAAALMTWHGARNSTDLERMLRKKAKSK